MADIVSSFDSPDALTNGVSELVRNFIGAMAKFIPDFIAAVLIFLVGYLIALILSAIVKKVMEQGKFEQFLVKHKMADSLGSLKISNFFVKVVKYYIILLFLQASVSKLDLGTLTVFMDKLLIYAPAFVGASVLVVVSAMFGELVKEKVRENDPKSKWVMIVARLSKFLVIFFGLIMALSTVGFNTQILKDTFLTILQAFAYGVALAIGIAFGLGGQSEAKDLVEDVRKKLNK